MRNQAAEIEPLVAQASAALAPLVSDYELVIVDNASEDDTVAALRKLTGEQGFPNLQVYALTKEVDADTASWVGLENALGDFVAVADPLADDLNFLPTMLDRAVAEADVVFAMNDQQPRQSLAYRGCFWVFRRLYQWFNGIDMAREAPHYRVISKRVG